MSGFQVRPAALDRFARRLGQQDAAGTCLGLAERARREFRANLAVFARRQDDPAVREMVADVLAGRRDVGDVLQSEAFIRVGREHDENLMAGMAAMTPEQRAEAFGPDRPRTPQRDLIALRDADDVSGWAPEDAEPEDVDRDPLQRWGPGVGR